MTDSKPKGYAVELYFDQKMEDEFFSFRESLYKLGIDPVLGLLGDRPHVSLAVFGEIDIDQIIKITTAFAPQCKQLAAQLDAFGAFPTTSNVIYLLPVPSQPLLELHRKFHELLQKEKILSSHYYLPGQWVPHCTLEFELPDDQLNLAFQLCKKHFSPIRGTFSTIGVIAFRPIEYLAEFPLPK
ncbi:MAG: 2'-5' RNA ligase family protein [Anaerolineaceae bacterium]